MPRLSQERAKVYDSAARRDSDDTMAPHILSAVEVIHPHCGDPALLTTSPPRRKASPADLQPPAPRFAQDAALGCPSRVGERLHYRDGSITDLAGQTLFDSTGQPLHTRAPADYKPLHRTLQKGLSHD